MFLIHATGRYRIVTMGPRCQCVVCPSHRDAACAAPAGRLVALALDPPQGWATELRLRVCDACHAATWEEVARYSPAAEPASPRPADDEVPAAAD